MHLQSTVDVDVGNSQNYKKIKAVEEPAIQTLKVIQDLD